MITLIGLAIQALLAGRQQELFCACRISTPIKLAERRGRC